MFLGRYRTTGAFRTILLGSYKLCVACAPTFPLSEQTLSLRQLCTFPLLLREQGSAIRDTLDSVLSLSNQKLILFGKVLILLHLLKLQKQG